jgi:hypothetical protein
LIFLVLPLFSSSAAQLSADDPFLGTGVMKDYVPEGKPKQQSRISTVERCQSACAVNRKCKAFAFRASTPACYFYSQVYIGGTPLSRESGIVSSGLSIVPKEGFVSPSSIVVFRRRLF